MGRGRRLHKANPGRGVDSGAQGLYWRNPRLILFTGSLDGSLIADRRRHSAQATQQYCSHKLGRPFSIHAWIRTI